ncbi:MAG: Asp-tRNA(Asn)/Glu-tRNA(Gln) amidotransferase subunit GatA [Nanoarchaeota archaeon]
MNITLNQKLAQIKSGKLTAEKNVAEFGEKIQKLNKKLNVYLVLNTRAIEEAKEIDKRIKQKKQVGKLAGLCVAIKSNICVKDLETNCASKVLEGYVPGYDASVIEKLREQDAIILGMVNMDEFACGASGETSAFGPVKNFLDNELIPGGSSSGSAVAVSADLCDFALGSDTGGSIRNPASHCGIVGFKPSYGSVSRYGLIDLAMNFDQIGVLAKNTEDAKYVFDIIKGADNFDTTTLNFKESKIKDKIAIGIVNVQDFCDKKIADAIKKKTQDLARKNNWKIKEINLPLDIALQTYYIIAYVEFYSGTRKFDGRRFGKKIEEFGGQEILRRILGGSEISKAEYHGKYYRKALKAKNFIKNKFEQIFKDVDLLIMPTVPKLPHKIGEKISVEDMYAYDVLTVLANIAQIPAISIPAGKIEQKPIGLQILAQRFSDNQILETGKKFE